ncbi:MAG: hypothetical protein WC878_02060 [Candidatus Paceibacterota bacterium]|jgi:hypothetical protein
MWHGIELYRWFSRDDGSRDFLLFLKKLNNAENADKRHSKEQERLLLRQKNLFRRHSVLRGK